MSKTSEPALKELDRLIGTWSTEATHPALPGVVVHGTVHVEWLEGQKFLLHRARSDHPDFPDSISVIGFMDQDRVEGAPGGEPAAGNSRLRMHYFDSRGVFRVYEVGVDEQALRFWRYATGFSQRYTGRFEDGGDTIAGLWQMNEGDVHWADDLQITYRRRV